MNARKAKRLRNLARRLTLLLPPLEGPAMTATDFKLRRSVPGVTGPMPIISATSHHAINTFPNIYKGLKAGRNLSKSDWRSDVE